MIGAARALWTLYGIGRRDRAAIIAAVQFMEGQWLANDLAAVLRDFPADPGAPDRAVARSEPLNGPDLPGRA